MSESTLEAPPVAAPAPEYAPAAAPAPWTVRGFMREHPWWTTSFVVVLVTVIFVRWAGTRPSFDGYGFLVWGYQTIHLSLDLGGAPSWKPLPYLFTVPFALFGHYQLWMWMITEVAVTLAGCIIAGRIVYRIVAGASAAARTGGAGDPASIPLAQRIGAGGDELDKDGRLRRYAAIAGAVFAGLALLGLEDAQAKIPYLHFVLSAQSDSMIVTFCLAAIDSHLLGRRRLAFFFGALAALGRPEVWPFLALYSLWCWFRVPSCRLLVTGGWLVILFMWFGIPTITNHRPFVSAQLAEKSPRVLRGNKVTGTIDRFIGLQYLPMWIAALAAVGLAFLRRNRLVLFLSAGALGWVVVEAAFALHGWPALPRYLFEPAAVSVVLAGIAVGWILSELPRLRRGIPRWAGVPIVAVLIGTLVPGALARMRTERKDLTHERARTHQIALLQTTTRALHGAQRVRACGQPVTNVGYVSAMAWFYHLNVGNVGGLQQHVEVQALKRPVPKVLFYPLAHGGWRVVPWHTLPSMQASCRRLRAAYEITRLHPGGILVHH